MEIQMKVNPISVTELNKYVKDRISQDEYLNNVTTQGIYILL